MTKVEYERQNVIFE